MFVLHHPVEKWLRCPSEIDKTQWEGWLVIPQNVPTFLKEGQSVSIWIWYSPRIPEKWYHLRCFYSVLKMSIYPPALAQTFYLYVVLITDLATIKYWQLQGGLENLHWRFLTSISRLSHTLPADAFYFLGENVGFHHTQLCDFNYWSTGGLGAAI